LFKRQKPYSSQGKAIFVTGAASGIGKATVFELVSRGCFVFAADINEKALNEAFKSDPNIRIVKLDVTSSKQVSKIAELVKQEGKGLYGVVNSAGVGHAPGRYVVSGASEVDVELDVLPVFQINYFGAIRVTNTIFPFILASKGCIVNIVSAAGRVAALTTYSDSKFALNAHTAILRRQLKPFGVRAVAIEPSWVDTAILDVIKNKTLDTSTTMFKDQVEAAQGQVTQLIQKGQLLSADFVAKHIADALFDPNPTPHQVVDRPLGVLMWIIVSSLPHTWTDAVLARMTARA